MTDGSITLNREEVDKIWTTLAAAQFELNNTAPSFLHNVSAYVDLVDTAKKCREAIELLNEKKGHSK